MYTPTGTPAMQSIFRLSLVVALLSLLVTPALAAPDTAEDLADLEALYVAVRAERFAAGEKLDELEAQSTAFIEANTGTATDAELAAARAYRVRCWVTAGKFEEVLAETKTLLAMEDLEKVVRGKLLYYQGSAAIQADDRALTEASVEELMKVKPDIGGALRTAMYQKWAAVVVGQPAPQWTLPRLPKDGKTGKSLSLASLEGKYVLLDFWATWCGPCKMAMKKELEPMHKKYGDDERFELISIGNSWGKDTAEKQAAFAKSQGYKWTKVFDGDAAVTSSYGVTGIPTFTFIGPDGKVIAHGYMDKVLPKVKETLKTLDVN
jgi:thiol-disulfide isomerase/thioredoxin